MNSSLSTRMFVGAAAVLTIFVLLTALALERAFEDSGRTAVQERLRGQLYLLIGETEVGDDGKVVLPASSTLAKLNQPNSGLYATVHSGGKRVWRSRSVMLGPLPFVENLAAGDEAFTHTDDKDANWFILGYGVEWQVGDSTVPLTFSLVEDTRVFAAQLAGYRQTLWGWLGGMAALLLLAQLLVLRWGLQPLRTVANDLSAIERGEQDALHGNYPRELQGLTGNLNNLLGHERAQQQRYRNALADLAHSLKTPLAVLQGAATDTETVREQVKRMQQTVDYQLQRAATTGHTGLNTPQELLPLVESLVAALQKVHADKHVTVEIDIDSALALRADKGDLTELLGNLLDNAFKWCAQTVRLHVEKTANATIIRIADDGPGIQAELADDILQRGVRADESIPGHGIGLAIVRDIISAYDGTLEIGVAPPPASTGALLTVTLPRL